MIIGIDASRANRSLRTGTEWYSFHIIKHLVAVDQENQYILYVDKEVAVDLKEALSPYKNVRFKKLSWPWPFFWTLGRLSLEMLLHRPDVLFVPAHSLPLINPKKTITTIHDIAFARERNLYQKKFLKTDKPVHKKVLNSFIKMITNGRYSSHSLDYLFWSTTHALKKAKAIITVSEFTKNEIIEVYSRRYESKLKVVHNSYDASLYRFQDNIEDRNMVLKKYGIRDPFFLYVGRLEKKKNTSSLVEAFAIFKEKFPDNKVKLVMIGNAGFGFDEIKYIIEEYNLDNEIIIPGWAEEHDLPYIFSAALAFVFPSLHEGFGIPVLQAMACHAPAIISDLPVLREVAGQAAFFFNPRDREDMLRALELIYQDEDLRNSLIEKGIIRAAQFSWDKAARETLAIIKSL